MRLILAAALLLLAGCVEARPSHEDLRGLALALWFAPPGAIGVCGGTPVAADELVTAQHCLDAGVNLVKVGKADPGTYTAIREQGDVVRLKFDRPMFTRWAKRGTVRQGERVRFWGNPKFQPDVYRDGVVAAVVDGLVAVDATVCAGDSGSGLFNDAGELVGVVSQRGPEQAPCQFLLAVPL